MTIFYCGDSIANNYKRAMHACKRRVLILVNNAGKLGNSRNFKSEDFFILKNCGNGH